MEQNNDWAQVWTEYSRALEQAQRTNLFDEVQRSEDFYVGDQWKGCEARELDKPVMNILRRVVSYFISSIVSDDIAISVSSFFESSVPAPVLTMVENQLAHIMENARVKRKLRLLVRNAAVDGDGCLHYWFDPQIASPKPENAGFVPTPGGVCAEVLENYNVFFGDAQCAEVERQPWVILRYRRGVKEVKAKGLALTLADGPDSGVNTDGEMDKVTVLRKYWKQGGTVWVCESLRGGWLTKPMNTGLCRYPLVWMNWEPVKNRWHGQSAIAALIPNQIFLNKLYAMAMRHVQMCAFPKVVYNKSMLPGGWSNRVGEAIGVAGAPEMAVGQGIKIPDMSAQVLGMIRQVISDTRDTMGASDAALGNIRPDNTSAIIATQKATSQPLEIQRLAYFDLVEDSVRIWLDMMVHYYGVRYVELLPGGETGEEGEPVLTPFDFSRLAELELQLTVDVGTASYWSELVQTQTMDNLYKNGVIRDPLLYLESVPAGHIKDKNRLIRQLRRQQEQAVPLANAPQKPRESGE